MSKIPMPGMFDIKPYLDKYDPQWVIVYGPRANGKSWSVKKDVVERFRETGEEFMYVRRYDQDLKSKAAARYFSDFVQEGGLKKASKGKYKDIKAYSSEYIMVPTDESAPKEVCGYYIPLSTSEERLKSQAFPNVGTIIFEEFLTHRLYLPDEFSILMNLVSGVFRHRKGRIILIGNTISPVCPLFEELGVDDVTSMAPGSHKLYHKTNQNGEQVNILLIHAPQGKINTDIPTSMIFGRPGNMILSGEWDIAEYPRRPKGEYETHYEIGLNFPQYSFILQMQTSEEQETPILFVYPNKHGRKLDRVLQDEISPDPMITRELRDDIRVEPMIHSLWKSGKVFYANDLCGNMFNTSLLNSQVAL